MALGFQVAHMLVVKFVAVEMLVHHEPQDGLPTRPF
jgi:hypothetical protein